MSALQFAAPAVVLINRLARDMLAGHPLEGLQWAVPTMMTTCTQELSNRGEDSLPCIQLVDYTFDEKDFAGGKPAPTTTNSQNLASTHKLLFILSVSREKAGFFNPAGGTTDVRRGLLEWAAFISDTMNRNDAGTIDGCLNGTCRKPIYVALQDNVIKQVAIHAGFEVTIYPQGHERGTITDPMAT